MKTKIFADLRDKLASFYPDEQSIRTVIDDSDIDAARIVFNTAAKQIWHFILKEADKIDKVDALLDVINKDYGTNKEFQKLCEAYKFAKPFDIFSQENYANSPKIERLNVEEFTVSILEDKEREIKGNIKNPLARDVTELRSWFFKELQPKEQSLLLTTALFAGMGRQKLLEITADIEKLLTIDE